MCNPHRPKFSIITITYNSEKTLEETIKSVVTQDYDNYEYLIIDGGSNDGTLDIVNKYRDKIAYVVSEPDKGISDAFNKGVKAATGEIVGIINSDDILEDGALLCLANEYEPNIDVYSGNLLCWDPKGNRKFLQYPDLVFNSLKAQYGVCHPSRFIRRDAYKKWGTYNVNLRFKMDIDLLVRFYRNGAQFKHINKTLARFRLGGATSSKFSKKIPDIKLFVLGNGWTKLDYYYVLVISFIRDLIKKIIGR